MLKKQLKNSEMVVMVQNLRPLLQLRNKIGYIAARNFRMLSTALTEYEAFKHDLINKYGGDRCVRGDRNHFHQGGLS